MDSEKFIKTVNKLIVKTAQGDSRALEALFDLTKKPLLYVAKSYLNDKSKAEDVLSNTYLKVVRNASNFDRSKNGYNWLYEITKNTALNENRKDSRCTFNQLEIVPYYECFDELCSRIAVEKAIASLSQDERRIIYEYFFEKKTLQEIAVELGKSKSTVHAQIKAILKKLKELLD